MISIFLFLIQIAEEGCAITAVLLTWIPANVNVKNCTKDPLVKNVSEKPNEIVLFSLN